MTMKTNTIILETKNVSKSFLSGGEPLMVLDQVSFSVHEGDTCAILGHSGSGKTTFLGLCAGLDQPSSGQIFFKDHELTASSEEALAEWRVKNVGFIFQTFRLISTLTALENVMVPGELQNNSEAESLAKDLLVQMGLRDRMNHFSSQLSGGEQQRVALARAFINRPQILFADEPTGNLDDKNAEMVMDLLFDLNKKWNTTLILVTHNQELAHKTNHIYHFDHGRLIKQGNV